MDTVIILMSTYNGERFLKEQLDSIFLQEGVDIHLCVRDDGSIDNTLKILFDYKKKFDKKIDILIGENLGWKKSFFELLKYATVNYSNYNYFAFADQDDIWLSKKIISGIEIIKKFPAGPNLYCSNLYYYKDGINHGKIRKTLLKPTLKQCLVRNYAIGCTIIFNKNLLDVINNRFPEIIVPHDYWIYQVATICGNVCIDNNAYILYRQHADNQVGCKSSWGEVWHRRIKNFSTTLKQHNREEQANELLKQYQSIMSEEALEAVLKISTYRNCILNRLKLLFDNGYGMGRFSNTFWLKLRILFGKL